MAANVLNPWFSYWETHKLIELTVVKQMYKRTDWNIVNEMNIVNFREFNIFKQIENGRTVERSSSIIYTWIMLSINYFKIDLSLFLNYKSW